MLLRRAGQAVCHRPHSFLCDRWELLTSTKLYLPAHTKDPIKGGSEGGTNGEKEGREREEEDGEEDRDQDEEERRR